MTRKYKAIGNNVILKAFSLEDVTEGGIFIPEMSKQEHLPEAGEVLSVGSLIKTEEIEVGDIVYFTKHGNVEVEGKEILSVPYQNLNAKVTKK